MKKYEYKLSVYKLKFNIDLATDIERTLNKEGAKGWELVQWRELQEPLNTASSIQSTRNSINIFATWKREIKLSN